MRERERCRSRDGWSIPGRTCGGSSGASTGGASTGVGASTVGASKGGASKGGTSKGGASTGGAGASTEGGSTCAPRAQEAEALGGASTGGGTVGGSTGGKSTVGGSGSTGEGTRVAYGKPPLAPVLKGKGRGFLVQSHPYEPTYAEVLADLKLKAILDSIKPDSRHRLARALWDHSEHFWLILIAPVTHLPPELLQLILYAITDASSPPLWLMLVCKHWYTSVASIWASLKLGTRTPRDAVTRRLESNQLPLDIFVDTEVDCGDFTPSEDAFEAIFAAIEVTSRWRSLVVKSFPGQADLPEHLVYRGLQRCSNATMSRLKTFRVKCACEMSPLLDRLLRIFATTASSELTTVEINSANVISFLVPAYPSIFCSVKVLFLDISGTHDPVDLLPHLHQLEELTASRLSLPIYGHDINLPFVNTLRHLRLRAVSI